MLFVVPHAVALALLLLVAAAAGTAVAGGRVPLAPRAVLGLAVVGQLLVALGILGAVRPWVLVALAAAAMAGGAARWEGGVPRGRVVAAASLAALPLFLLALLPPLAFDETLYHLPIVRAIAGSGAIRFQPRLRFPIFPELHESLCVPAFLTLGDAATHLVSVGELLLLAALLAAWPRERHAGFLAAALVLGSPIALHLGTITYVETALSLFVAAGFFCLDRAASDDEGRFWAGAAGFLLGTACCVKYLGWYFAAAGLAFLLLPGPGRRRKVPVFLAALAVAVLPTYAAIAAFGGSPLFPFLPALFGPSPWEIALTGSAASPARLLRLFWDITFARERVNQQPPYSPLFALSLLVTLVAARRDRRAAFLFALAAGYVAVFPFLPQDSRYLIPLLPLASVAAASALSRWKTLSVALALLSMAGGAAYAGYRIARMGLPPVDAASRRAFLERNIPEYRALERRDPGGIYVCGAEQLHYFGGDDLLGDVVGPYSTGKVFASGSDSAQLARALTRIGARDLLVSRRICPPELQRLPAPPAFERVYADAGAVLWRVARPAAVESR